MDDKRWISWWCTVSFTILINRCHCNEEGMLIKSLLSGYSTIGGTYIRPVMNTSAQHHVKYGLGLLSILGFNEEEGSIKLRVRERYTWYDAFLRWDPKEFGGITDIRIPTSLIWTPDLTLYNGARETVKNPNELAMVSSDGNLLLISPATFNVLCSLKRAPHLEIQETCTVKIGSWTHNGFKLGLDFFDGLESFGLYDYVARDGLRILSNTGKKNVMFYPCCPEPFIDLMFTLTFIRDADQSLAIIPGILICLFVTSLCIFWLPPSFSARSSLGGNVLVGYILVLILAAIIPPENRLIDSFGSQTLSLIITTSVMIGCSSVSAILCDKSRDGCSVPDWMRVLFINVLSIITCVHCKRPSAAGGGRSEPQLMQNMETGAEVNACADMDNMGKQLQEISCYVARRQRAQINQNEWSIIAKVCDRVFFAVFCIMFIVFAIKGF